MINKWTELDLELFYEVLRKYLNHVGDSDNKVIEIQNMSDVWYDPFIKTRLFLGAKINPLDWEDWNERLVTAIRGFGESTFRSYCDLLFCCLGYAPIMSPLPKTGKTLDMFLATSFGDEAATRDFWKGQENEKLVLWYSRDEDGGIIYDMSRNPITLPDTKRFIRIRTMDYSDWKDMVEKTIKTTKQPEELTKDDLKKEEIKKVINHM